MDKLKVFDDEIWKDIQGYEGQYQVSNYGRIKSLSRKISNGTGYYISKEKILKGHVNTKGYIQVELQGKPLLVHRLVAEAFIENPYDKPQVNHIDGDKSNNMTTNLEWVTNGENQIHAYKNGLNKHSENAGIPPKKVCQIALITGEVLNIYNSIAEAGKSLNIKKDNISSVCKNKRKSCGGYGWKYYDNDDTTIIKGGDGNKGFNTLRVFEAFA